MTDHNSLFDLLGCDISALLGIAEYLDVLGRDRVGNLVRIVTFNIDQTVSDLRHDLLHAPHRNKPKVTTRRDREHVRSAHPSRRKPVSGTIAKRATALTHRPKPIRPNT